MPTVSRRQVNRHFKFSLGLVVVFGISSSAIADERQTARKFYDRLTGVVPNSIVMNQMTQKLQENKPKDAAMIAIESRDFYNVGLKTFFTPWTNESQTADAPLNDYSATLIGAVRDELPFDRVLYDDIIYTSTFPNIAGYANNNNAHYNQMDNSGASLKSYLDQQTQSAITGRAEAPGIMGTRQFGAQFFSMGTNRRAVRFMMINFMCHDMENLSDTTRPGHRIRRDVDRRPGGDSETFRNTCRGCHTGLDANAGAFAHYNFANGAVVHTPDAVQQKYLQNDNIFPRGYVTTNDSWENPWFDGVNKKLGWQGDDSGNGPTEWGEMLSKSAAFPDCMAKRVFTHVCLRDPRTDEDLAKVNQLSANFSTNEFNMKDLFAETAVSCLVEE